MATPTMLAAAVTATGGMMVTASIAQCLGYNTQEKLIEVPAAAVVKNVGDAPCLLRGGWRKHRRHVTFIGENLVVSHKPGATRTQAIVPMKGARVAVEDDAVSVISKDGRALVKFWPSGGEEELQRWAAELDPSTFIAEVPKMLSVTRAQMEKIKAEAMQWESRIKNAREGDPSSIAALEAEMNEREERIVTIEGELDGFKGMPKMLSLNRKQIAELEADAKQKDAHVATMQAQIEGVGEMPKMLSLNRRQIAELEAAATEKDLELSTFQKRLEELQNMPKQLSISRNTIASLQAQTQEKEGLIAALKVKLNQLQEMPKLLNQDRKQVAQLEVAKTSKDSKISELQEELKTYEEMPKILSLNRKQVTELVARSNQSELQLVRLQRELQKERAKMCAKNEPLPSCKTNAEDAAPPAVDKQATSSNPEKERAKMCAKNEPLASCKTNAEDAAQAAVDEQAKSSNPEKEPLLLQDVDVSPQMVGA